MGYIVHGGHKESDWTERLTLSVFIIKIFVQRKNNFLGRFLFIFLLAYLKIREVGTHITGFYEE